MNKIQSPKKFELFLEGYDSRADARLDDTLEEPLRGGTKSEPPSVVTLGNIKMSMTYSQK